MSASKKNREREKRVIELVRKGSSPAHASAAIGLHRATVLDWRKRDEKFDAALSKAECEYQDKLVKAIERQGIGDPAKNMTGDWRALAWLLARRFPEDFGDPERRLELQMNTQINNNYGFSKEEEDEWLKCPEYLEGARRLVARAEKAQAEEEADGGDGIAEVGPEQYAHDKGAVVDTDGEVVPA